MFTKGSYYTLKSSSYLMKKEIVMDNAYFVYIWSFLSTITVSCCENDDLMSQLILHDLFVLTLHISCTLMT